MGSSGGISKLSREDEPDQASKQASFRVTSSQNQRQASGPVEIEVVPNASIPTKESVDANSAAAVQPAPQKSILRPIVARTAQKRIAFGPVEPIGPVESVDPVNEQPYGHVRRWTGPKDMTRSMAPRAGRDGRSIERGDSSGNGLKSEAGDSSAYEADTRPLLQQQDSNLGDGKSSDDEDDEDEEEAEVTFQSFLQEDLKMAAVIQSYVKAYLARQELLARSPSLVNPTSNWLESNSTEAQVEKHEDENGTEESLHERDGTGERKQWHWEDGEEPSAIGRAPPSPTPTSLRHERGSVWASFSINSPHSSFSASPSSLIPIAPRSAPHSPRTNSTFGGRSNVFNFGVEPKSAHV